MRRICRLEIVASGVHDPVWIVDFPMFAWNAAEERWDPLHHPFTAPRGDLDDPGGLRSRAYDLVLDGFEIGGGSIRINDPDVQRRVLELIGIGPEEAQARFGFLLDAFRYGAPPHAGFAFGLDRLTAILAGEENIREVIAFPKTQSGADPLDDYLASLARIRRLEVDLVLPAHGDPFHNHRERIAAIMRGPEGM